MAEEEQKKGRLATAVLAGSALAFSSFAFGAPAAFADTEADPSATEATTEGEDTGSKPEDADATETPTPTAEKEETESEKDSTDEVAPSLTADTETVSAGETLALSGTDFTSDGVVRLTMQSDDNQNTITIPQVSADDSGAFETNVEIPESATSGQYTIGAEDAQSGQAMDIKITVEAEEDGTGEDANDKANEGGENDTNDDEQDSEEPVVDPVIELSTNEAYPGETVAVTGSGFTTDSTVTVTVNWQDAPASSQTDENGEFTGSFSVPSDQEPGSYTLTVIDDASEEEVSADFEILELAEPTLRISPEEIALKDFIRTEAEGDDENGVVHEVVGLDEGDKIAAVVDGPQGVEPSEFEETADENGVASFVIYGYDTVDPASVYLGTYQSEITLADSEDDLLQGSFKVVEEPGDEAPGFDASLDLAATEAYPGEIIEVSGSAFTANGTVDFSINPPLGSVVADDNGAFETEVAIPEDLDPGQYEFTAYDVEADQGVKVDFTVLDEADDAVEASLSIDPTKIKLNDFIGDPEDGAGVDHRVEGLEPGVQYTYTVRGPENVNDFEQSGTADDEGVAEFVIHGFDVANPEVYLGDYTTVVAYENGDGQTDELQGDFAVVTDDGSTGSTAETASDGDSVDTGEPTDLNGSDRLADTGSDSTHLGLIAGVLLTLGGALVVVANRKRLFANKS